MKRNLLQSAIVLIVIAGLLALAGCIEPETYLSPNPNDDLEDVTDANGLEGYWRRDNLVFGEEEDTDVFMYDWYKFNKNGTYHVYHYMDKDKYCADLGEFSYYIDDDNQFISTDKSGKTKIYYDFKKPGDNAFSWKTASNGPVLGFERFDGETFWQKQSSIVRSSLSITDGLEGYWRRENAASSSMYDWYEFSNNGTYHVYHYMSNNPKYADRGEFSYRIDSANNRLISTDKNGKETIYYDFKKTGDNAFSWKATSNGSVLGFERFDGETFKKESSTGSSGSGNGNSSGRGGCCCC